METLDCISSRRSIRAFQERKVSPEIIGQILEAANASPSAGNLQDTKIVIVQDEEGRNAIAEACVEQHWIAEAPVVLVLGVDPTEEERMYGDRGKDVYLKHNSAAMAENILLAAHSLGLGACWVGAFAEDMLRNALNMGEDVMPQVVIPIGYADEQPKKLDRLDIDQIMFFEKWGNKADDPLGHLGYTSHKVAKTVKRGKEAVNKLIK
jgi:nitroreductase